MTTQGTVPTESDGSVTQWMDPDQAATDRGPADFDRRHNLTANFIWTTPGLTHAPGALRHLLGDWMVSGILALRSGNPFTVGIEGDYSRTLARVSVHRPNLVAASTRTTSSSAEPSATSIRQPSSCRRPALSATWAATA